MCSRDGQERYVALKVLTAAASRANAHDIAMYHRFQELRSNKSNEVTEHPGLHHCVEPLAIVSVESGHGLHRCIVTAPYGSTVDDIQVSQPHGQLTLPVVKNVVRQTLLALEFLHDVMDVVHAGVQGYFIRCILVLTAYVLRHQSFQSFRSLGHCEGGFGPVFARTSFRDPSSGVFQPLGRARGHRNEPTAAKYGLAFEP